MSTRPGTLQPMHMSPFIEQVTGDDKGKIFELGSTQLTIGRARENDIVVQSEAVSRLHARLIQSDGGWFIRDNGSKNGIMVNGKNCRESWLQTGDIVQVGDFVFRFNDPGTSSEAAAAPAASAEPAMEFQAAPQTEIPVVATTDYGTAPTQAKKKKNRRPMIYGLVVLAAAAYYFTSSDAPAPGKTDGETPTLARQFKTSEEPNLGADAKPKRLIGLEDPILKEAEVKMSRLDWTNMSLRQSEQLFKKGQREYLSQNYHRAIDFFQSAIQLYRGHLVAERFLKRAIYEAELEAKNNMALGIQYYSSLQYQRAMYHFSEVVTLMSHRPKEPVVAEATRYIEQCKRMLVAAELYPGEMNNDSLQALVEQLGEAVTDLDKQDPAAREPSYLKVKELASRIRAYPRTDPGALEKAKEAEDKIKELTGKKDQ